MDEKPRAPWAPLSLPSSVRGPAAETGEPAERYSFVSVLGEGGMGQVLAYDDTSLGRRVAVKIARGGRLEFSSALVREARITGRLEHPNIIPIYDIGREEDWGTFYLMRLVEQTTLEQALRKLRRGEGQYNHGRLLRMFIQVCEAIEYAHSRGVVHCDLKPGNVLVGKYGEVLVVDWGFALEIGKDPTPGGGTAGYMPPEQLGLEHHAVDARTDVFALGVVLYELLADKRPYPDVSFAEWRRARARGEHPFSPAVAPSERAPDRFVPLELEELCMRAIELDKEKRLPTALDLANGLEAFLEGSKVKKRKQKRAEELARQGEGLAESYGDLRASRAELADELAQLRESSTPWDVGPAKQALWDAEDRDEVMESLTERTFQAAISSYEHALDEEPEHAPARRALHELYARELGRAKTRRDRVHFEMLALEYDDGTLAETLRGGGSASVLCARAADVLIEQLGEHGRVLAPVRAVAHGPAPIGAIALEAGSYVATIHGDGGEIRMPFLVSTGRAVQIEIDLSAKSGDPAQVLVAAGSAIIGGHATHPFVEAREIEVPTFSIARFPVTFAEYFTLLHHARENDPDALDALMPRSAHGDPYWRFAGPALEPAAIKVFGDDATVLAALPAFGVDLASAAAYAAYRAKLTGLPYRLPGEWEWERAARGADGRVYAWGNRFDATLCKMRDSRPLLPAPEPPGAFATDVSPFGVRDLTGGIADWVIGASGSRERTIARGGAWCDWAIDCQLATRRVYRVGERSERVGFRLALG